MGDFKVELLAPAALDFESVAQKHLMLSGVQSAEKITNRIMSALEQLEKFPQSGLLLPDSELNAQGYRMIVCGNYLVVYRLNGNTVFVYHIADGRMDYPKLFK